MTVGPRQALASPTVALEHWAPAGPLRVGAGAVLGPRRPPARHRRRRGAALERPQRRVAPGQSVVCYDPAAPDEVLGGAIAANG
ncbi:MAG: aminomethyltransferase beta-barrel domain-containing protein [Acidimicrobiales bacterium]